MPALDLALAGSVVPSGFEGQISHTSGLWDVRDDGVSTLAKRVDPIFWYIASAAILGSLSYNSCNKPDPKWLDSLTCFASSAALTYVGLAGGLRALAAASKRSVNVHIASFNTTVGGIGTHPTLPIDDILNGELHKMLSVEVNDILHESFYQYIKEDDMHLAKGRVTFLNEKRQLDGKDGGVEADYMYKAVDVGEGHRIGNQDDDKNGSFEGAFLNSGANDESYAHHVELFCADLKDVDGAYNDLAIRGAYFIGPYPGGFPYQPGMAQAIVNNCHNGE